VDLYTATRHDFAWYARNVLGLDPTDIAQHFGHEDGSELVRRLYRHFDQARARDRVREDVHRGARLDPAHQQGRLGGSSETRGAVEREFGRLKNDGRSRRCALAH
jgi:hypothetical protein